MNEALPPGDLNAAELFRDHAAFVARFLYRLGVPAQAIDDTVQDVFLVVHQRGGYRPGPAKPTTYLAVIASHVASTERRQQRRRAARAGNTPLEEVHAQEDDPALRVERRDDLRRLQDALSRLDPTLRDTLVLADFEDETAPAIAHAMGVPVGTVYYRLHEARKKFQHALAVTDGNRAWIARQRSSQRRLDSLSRGAKLLAFFGWIGGSSTAAQARELGLTWRSATVGVDLTRGLERHFERVSAGPSASAVLPSAATKLASVASTGALPIGAWTVACAGGALATVATVALLWRGPDDVPSDDSAEPAQVAHAEAAQAEGTIATSSASSTAPPAITAKALQLAVRSVPTAAGAVAASAPDRPRTAAAERDAAHGSAEAPRPRELQNPERTADPVPRERAPGRPDRSAPDRASMAAPVPPTSASISRRTTPAPAPADHHDPLLEARALERAHRSLATDPAEALAIVEAMSGTLSEAYLSEERHYVRVMALYGVGRQGDADRAADRFLSRYPSSAFRERVQAARTAAASGP